MHRDRWKHRRKGQSCAGLHEIAVLLLQSIPQLGNDGCCTGDRALPHLLVLVLGCQPRLHSLQDRAGCCLQQILPLYVFIPSSWYSSVLWVGAPLPGMT